MPSQHHACDHTERVVVLENEVSNLKEDLKEILKTVKEIDEQMTRYKGFLGGITFVVSAIGVFWSFGKDWILNHWK